MGNSKKVVGGREWELRLVGKMRKHCFKILKKCQKKRQLQKLRVNFGSHFRITVHPGGEVLETGAWDI